MIVQDGAALVAIFLPVSVAFFSHWVAGTPKIGARLAKTLCVLASCVSFFLICLLFYMVRNGPIKTHFFTVSLPIGVASFGLYIDFLALVPAFFSSLFTVLALTYNVYYLSPYNRAYRVGWDFDRSYPFILLFNGAMLGALFSSSLLGLLIFWELFSICSYALISFWNEDRLSLGAAMKFFVMTHMGSLALLIAMVIIFFSAGTLEITELSSAISVGDPIISVVFPLLLVAALPKTVLFPLHSWLPDATVAPTSAILVFHEGGTLAGVYMFLRFFLDVFRVHVASAAPMPLPFIFGNVSVWGFIISLIGATTIIIGALNGLVENDVKRIVAYGSISGLGYTAMAVGLITPLGSIASLFLMISHALCFGLLFLCAGAMIYATGKHDINEMGGLYQSMPITAFCCLIGVLAWSTVPLLSEFAGKYLLFHAAINVQATLFAAIAFLGCVLNVAVAMRLLHSVLMQKPTKPPLIMEDPPAAMLAPMVLLAIFLIVLGVAPTTLLNSMVIPAANGVGLPAMVVAQWLVETPLGFWDPSALVISMVGLFALFSSIMFYLGKAAAFYRKSPSEETFKPFLCGEDINLLDSPNGSYFYHVLTNVAKVDYACKASNVDVAYNKLSNKFFGFCEKLLRLDIQQNYFAAFASFIAGAIVIVLVAVLGG
jgi:NADH:ubiquinone oxidoreductase subunit 5 (subunit L)/multisubunit Na+/H+ antiporter MnhA subunit